MATLGQKQNDRDQIEDFIQQWGTAMTGITDNWPDLSALPSNAQIALERLRRIQEHSLCAWRWLYSEYIKER